MPLRSSDNFTSFLDGLDLPAPARQALALRQRPRTAAKICGLSTPETVAAALDFGADLVGFVFFEKSPRHLSLDQAAGLARIAGTRAIKVALTVDADDETLAAIMASLSPDMLQLHGRETPGRVGAIRARFGLPVMKAIGISGPADLAQVQAYSGVADRILFDAKPPAGADLPGGNGQAFDWSLLAGLNLPAPFMLSGGLDASNVVDSVRQTGAGAVDVSSGVESSPGQKDPARIAGFLRALHGADGDIETLGSTAATR
jgi:phosphoribosylanthranilate isomerase